VVDRSVSVPMTLSDLERRDTRVKFQADLLNNARTVWPRTTKFGRITYVRGERILTGRCPSASQCLEFLFIYAYILWRRTTKFDVETHVGGAGLFTPSSQGGGVSALLNLFFFLLMRTPFVAELPNLTW